MQFPQLRIVRLLPLPLLHLVLPNEAGAGGFPFWIGLLHIQRYYRDGFRSVHGGDWFLLEPDFC